ncbi:YtxH domain-containing protein [Cohnella zeiphila]|nr:YtxH domain-containing protein [Cohnella zeiphila]
MAESKSMLKGVLVGGAVGAAAALLLAPKSGRELRQDIRDKYRQTSDKAKTLVTNATEKTKEIVSHVGQRASEVADKTQSVVRAVKDEAENRAPSQTPN